MMTLDEAIQHCEKRAEEYYLQGMLCHANPNDEELDDCIECAKDHEQLASWLKDYKVLKDRATPKKVVIEQYTPAYCPTCGEELSESWGDGYYKYYTHLDVCPNKECRQVLDWRYEE